MHRMKIGNPNFLILIFFDPQKGRTVGGHLKNWLKNQFSSDLAETWWRGAFLYRMKIGNPNLLILMFFEPQKDQKGRIVGGNPKNWIKN